MQTLDTLEIYILAKAYRREAMLIANIFPKEETYLLKSQLKDSSRSITANIAEGYGRYHYQEEIQFCRISRGSLLESHDHISTALDEDYISNEKFREMTSKKDLLLEKINGYIAYLKRRKKGE